LLTLILTTETTKAQSFSTAESYVLANNPPSVTSGDLNGDGKPDLVVPIYYSDSVGVLLNNGDGTFQAVVTYPTDQHSQSVTTGDFNSDGKRDLAVGNYDGGNGTGNVSILLGNGNGTFQAAVNYNGVNPAGLVATDLNGDGKLDLVFSSFSINCLSVLLGNGNGTFQAVTTYAAGSQPGHVVVADFNGDGKPDLATTNYSSLSISILLGNGNGTFQAPTSRTGGSFGLTLGDLNADGKQDLVSTGIGGVVVNLGNGNGTFQAPVAYSAGDNPGPPVAADFNGDGKADVAVGNFYTGTLSVLRGNGDGTLQSAISFPAKPNPQSLVVADFDIDGKPDVAIASNGTSRVNVLLNSPSLRPVAISATAVTPATGVLVATFKDYDLTKTAGSFTATINWGDSTTPTSGTIAANGSSGGFNVTGTHTYAKEGTYSVNVQIADASGNFASVTSTATVADAPLTATPRTITPIENTAFTSVVASFTDADPTGAAGEFSATISWGDGANSAGTITANGSGGFNVTGSHTYSISGSFQVVVMIQAVAGSTATANSTANVLDGGALQFGSATYSVAENAGSVSITITRSGGSAGTATVLLQTSNGTATAADYTSISQTISFNDGEISKTVNVSITDDLFKEPDETVNLALSNAGGSGQLGAQSTAVLTILDNDPIGGYIRFSSADFNTTESSGSTTITVERVGDTSQAVTVDYATSDNSGATTAPCSTTNHFASSRCDYTTSLGTLRFAAGESSKTFVVLISQDIYVEGLESLTVALSNLTGGAAFATPSTATLTITDDATEPATNPIDTADVFVRQHYHDFLNREPDASGLAFWANQITECQQPGATCNADERRVNVSAAFFVSIEFQETGYLVYKFYKAAYGNIAGAPVPVRLNELLPDTQQIGQGVVVGVGNWQTVLENNKVAYAQDFVSRARFTADYPTTLLPTQFVDALFLKAGVSPSTSERDLAVNEFGGAPNTTNIAARGRALRRIAENPTFTQQEFNRAFVLMQYFGYLRRNPNDAPEPGLNFDGYNFWLGKLNQFNGNYIAAEMVKAFITSGEYRQRFGP